MLVDVEAVKLRHPSFIIPTMNNSCAVHAWGISSRLPKLFTFQRACGRNHFKITLRQGRKNPILFKNRPRRTIVSSPNPPSRGKRGGFHFFYRFRHHCRGYKCNCNGRCSMELRYNARPWKVATNPIHRQFYPVIKGSNQRWFLAI